MADVKMGHQILCYMRYIVLTFAFTEYTVLNLPSSYLSQSELRAYIHLLLLELPTCDKLTIHLFRTACCLRGLVFRCLNINSLTLIFFILCDNKTDFYVFFPSSRLFFYV
jgi:hypothetical protein